MRSLRWPVLFSVSLFAALCFCPTPACAGDKSAASPSTASASTASRFAEAGYSTGTWLLQRDGSGPRVVHGTGFAASPQSPASTFKLMLALIALQTGELASAEEVVPWDGHAYPEHPEWQAEMALKRALDTSSESYFRVLAARIGRERLAEWVARAGYGNGRVGPNPTLAWHDGVLTVTPAQQLAFIDRLRRGALPFDAAHIAAVKSAMPQETLGDRRLYAKTGTHLGDDGSAGVGWWIGWVEGHGKATAFVLGIELKTADQRAKRIALGKRLLRDAGALPAR